VNKYQFIAASLWAIDESQIHLITLWYANPSLAYENSRMNGPSFGTISEFRAARAIVTMVIAVGLLNTVAQAEYRLGPGDILEFTAVGLPDLRERVVIDVDGLAHFPLIGPIQVAGATVAQVRANVQIELTKKVFRRRVPDGREFPIVLTPDEITVLVAQYRPVYLNGDVSRPGEQPYRPRMTVHQAIAMAGGYEIMRFRMNNPLMDATDFRHELTALQVDYARQSAVVDRLMAELENKTHISGAKEQWESTGDASIVSAVKNTQAEQLRLRSIDYDKERSYLQGAVDLVRDRVHKLTEQQEQEKEGTAADLNELGRINDLVKKGTLPFPRSTDARRTALLSSTSLLQTGASLGLASLERRDLERRLQKLPDARRLDLVRELETAQVDLAKLRSRIVAVQRKIAYAGILRSQLSNHESSRPKLTIFRDSDDERKRIEAEEYTELLPGDLIEVSIWADDGSAAENAARLERRD
jgi:polysaccharide biosynthesis/export protein